ncbi:MAG: dihydroorotase [Clostridiales bacterium]|nr:dihydroorotase [Clostridiales bacterium]
MEREGFALRFLSEKHRDDSCKEAIDRFLTGGGRVPVSFGPYMVFPGFCDVHVHFRQPGYFYKETIETGSRAAVQGGYTAVCTMPNLNPVPDSPETLRPQLDAIRTEAVIPVYPYGAITRGERGEELADLDGLASRVCAFSDDGRGVQSGEMMRRAMTRARALGKIVAAHCEDNSLLNGGYIHDGVYARAHGHRGISSESEYRQIERDLKLAAETGCKYHVCHISTKESVALIRKAKAAGVDVTCETGPHYLVLCDEDLQEDGRFKMNPPLRGREDREALIAGLLDGTIDMIATDHAPHSAEEKSGGLENSLMGVVGLETAFPVLYTHLVKPGILTVERLGQLLSDNPRRRFGLEGDPGYAVFEVGTPYVVDPGEFASKGRSTPFAGAEVYGQWVLTHWNGTDFRRA